MDIANTTLHTDTGLVVDPFASAGAARLVPIKGATPGQPFILDPAAVVALRDHLNTIIAAGDEERAAWARLDARIAGQAGTPGNDVTNVWH